ncbi:hypothetical protein VC83_06484 [Pseudogymnoascus destructans]|uniref:Uncharacterized protein n=1 Tax=Pseudogymnoascus destructans TaxID=655981 RepID=A0A177A927_9PEZI|nr:uncharacterized protein VC83_06484 [Pseudogymnoascus destructans]OAF58250.1 hypothetical protein VC83_06484 [Pseudogymnoascus destructans]
MKASSASRPWRSSPASRLSVTGEMPRRKAAWRFVQSTGGGGSGTGFLATLTNGAVSTNYGHNGRTTVSFVAGGDWANVIADVKSKASKSYLPVEELPSRLPLDPIDNFVGESCLPINELPSRLSLEPINNSIDRK